MRRDELRTVLLLQKEFYERVLANKVEHRHKQELDKQALREIKKRLRSLMEVKI